jgi:hypothetical protein
MTAISRESLSGLVSKQTRYEALKILYRNHRKRRRPLVEGANRLSFKDPGKAGARGSAEGRMTAIAACRTCGTESLENAQFCHGCGSPVKDGDTRDRVDTPSVDAILRLLAYWRGCKRE